MGERMYVRDPYLVTLSAVHRCPLSCHFSLKSVCCKLLGFNLRIIQLLSSGQKLLSLTIHKPSLGSSEEI